MEPNLSPKTTPKTNNRNPNTSKRKPTAFRANTTAVDTTATNTTAEAAAVEQATPMTAAMHLRGCSAHSNWQDTCHGNRNDHDPVPIAQGLARCVAERTVMGCDSGTPLELLNPLGMGLGPAIGIGIGDGDGSKAGDGDGDGGAPGHPSSTASHASLVKAEPVLFVAADGQGIIDASRNVSGVAIVANHGPIVHTSKSYTVSERVCAGYMYSAAVRVHQ